MRKPIASLFTTLCITFGVGLTVQASNDIEISNDSFGCMLDMTPVRGFYVNNLLDGKLQETVAVATAGEGEYPPGSVVQLVPGEVMVKHAKGYNAATHDWEFFELNNSATGSEINVRGFVDVKNRFGGNCFACHVKAEPKYDMICETGHGCDPIPLTVEMKTLLQKTDPRCGNRYTPTPAEQQILQQLQAVLNARVQASPAN